MEKKEEPLDLDSVKDLNSLPPIFDRSKKIKEGEEKSPLVTDGEAYSINNETLIKLMVSGSKSAREQLIKRWQYLDLFKNDKDLGPFAMLLKDSQPYVMTENVLIVSFNLKNKPSNVT